MDGGAVKLTVAVVLPATADPIDGAPGTVAGTTLLEAAEAAPVPTAFVAVTVKVYALPFVRPVTVSGLDAPVAVLPSGLEVTVYKVIALPPFDAGAVKLTVAWPLPLVAVPIVGTPGIVAGITLLEAAEADPAPTALVAVTVKVYAVPLVSPVTVRGLDAPVAVLPSGLEATVYEMIAKPPLDAGAAKLTVAAVLPATADPIVGAPGTAAGTTLLEAVEGDPVPTAFVAVTANEYTVPFVNPVTVNGLDAPVAVFPPGLEVTVYEVIARPPFEAGAVKLTVAAEFPATAAPTVGTPGRVAGTTLLEEAEGNPVPTPLVAVTVNV